MTDLKEIATILRKDKIDYAELFQATQNFKKLALELSGFDMEDENSRKDLYFENGKAIGATWAALCIDDFMRTKYFIKGLCSAIDALLAKKEGPIHILYAGTGPFATLILPALAIYSKNEIQCTLLEINAISLESAKRVISTLGYDEYVLSYQNEDATKYTVDNTIPIDIVLSETMQCGLTKEQQVPIVINIMKQLKKETILIPEMIAVDLCLMNYQKFKNRHDKTPESDYCIVLDRLIEINSKKINDYAPKLEHSNTTMLFPEKLTTIHPKHTEFFKDLTLITRITVFGKEKILINESGLTLPIRIKKFSELSEAVTLKTRYIIDDKPRFEYEWI
jgi:predicted RNA methylase